MAPRKTQVSEEQKIETCNTFGTFIETRYTGWPPRWPISIPQGDERIAYDIHCFCGMIDSDGMECLMSQSDKKRTAMFRSLQKLGLQELVALTKKADTALRRAGLSARRRSDREAVKAVLGPFERVYHRRLRKQAFSSCYRLLSSSKVFIPYAINCARMEKYKGNPFDPKEWTPAKLKKAEKLLKEFGLERCA